MLRLKAYAKINLSLKIRGKRPDGFHEIESVMQSVSLCDYVTLTQIPSGIQLTTSHSRLPTDNRNLAYKAAELFFKIQNYGIKIDIEKKIPVAAGLAGGSADAAAVLFGLNQMAGNPLGSNELSELGAKVGSDVPFCLVGGNCLVRGRGEIIESRKLKVESRNYILIVPEVEVSTKWAYEAWDEMSNDKLQMTNKGIGNDLEPVVISKYPVIQAIKEALISLGCSSAQMSGSGPSVFGEAGDASAGEKILSQIKIKFPQSYLVNSVPKGIEVA